MNSSRHGPARDRGGWWSFRYLGWDDSVVSESLWYIVAMLRETVGNIDRPGVTLVGGVKALGERGWRREKGHDVGMKRHWQKVPFMKKEKSLSCTHLELRLQLIFLHLVKHYTIWKHVLGENQTLKRGMYDIKEWKPSYKKKKKPWYVFSSVKVKTLHSNILWGFFLHW